MILDPKEALEIHYLKRRIDLIEEKNRIVLSTPADEMLFFDPDDSDVWTRETLIQRLSEIERA